MFTLEDMKQTPLPYDPGATDSEPQFSTDGKTILFHRSTQLRETSLGGYAWYGSTVHWLDLKTKQVFPTWAVRIQSYNSSSKGEVCVAHAAAGHGARAQQAYAVLSYAALREAKPKALATSNSSLTSYANARSANLLWLPDGSVAYTDIDPRGSPYLGEIWIANAIGESPRQLTRLQSPLSYLRASPDGKSIYFLRGEVGMQALCKVELESGTVIEVLSPSSLGNLDKQAESRNSH